MIGSLRGNITNLDLDSVILECAGVGYLLHLPTRLLANLELNQEAFFLIHTAVREDDISLYGFSDASDKQVFLQLNKVSGVGAKTALNILSILNARQIADAIAFEDKAAFTQVSGIGPKAAVRIINDLKDKVSNLQDPAAQFSSLELGQAANQSSNNLLNDALSALENLGYQRAQILEVVKEHAANENDLSAVISNCLKSLAK